MDDQCNDCKHLEETRHQILLTDNWKVWLSSNQAYLGRVCITLRNHKSSLSELNEAEWQEFKQLVRKLEPAYKKAFGAYPLNWGCFMNNSFRVEPAYPHVHWHIFPRYKHARTIDGIEFDDPLYGEHYDPHAQKIVSDELLSQIGQKLKDQLA